MPPLLDTIFFSFFSFSCVKDKNHSQSTIKVVVKSYEIICNSRTTLFILNLIYSVKVNRATGRAVQIDPVT